MESNPFTVAGSRISLATVYNILEDLRKPSMTFRDVAERYHVSQTTAAHVFVVLCQDFGQLKLQNL